MVRFCGIFLLSTVLCLGAGRPEQPPKELVSYIQEAKKLGLNDAEIRRRAAIAGWEGKIVDEAFIAIEQPSIPASSPASVDVPDGYHIGAGDVLQVSVWREPDASVPSATVRGDGKISIPLIKEIDVVGLTPVEAERAISTKLSRYIHGADVTIIVKEIHSRKVYLVGGVKSVGAIQLKGSMTVLQAITEAGGLTDYAKRKNIYVLRTDNGRQIKLPFNYEAVIRGEEMGQNIVLSPDDTIVRPAVVDQVTDE